jgi:hypothetical protein
MFQADVEEDMRAPRGQDKSASRLCVSALRINRRSNRTGRRQPWTEGRCSLFVVRQLPEFPAAVNKQRRGVGRDGELDCTR